MAEDSDPTSMKEVLWILGLTIVHIQFTESMIAAALRFLFPEGGYVNERTLAQADKEGKMPLGPLLKRLRSRVHVDDGFADELASFLERRNTVVHNINRIPAFTSSRSETYPAAITYLMETVAMSKRISGGLGALLLKWADLVGMQRPEELKGFLSRIESNFDPQVLNWFSTE